MGVVYVSIDPVIALEDALQDNRRQEVILARYREATYSGE